MVIESLKEHSMITLENDELVFRFPEVHDDAVCRIGFQRTLRIPDDNKTYPLPAGLGKFAIRHVEDFAGKLPAKLINRGGVVMPMWQAEAMWIHFRGDHSWSYGGYPFAVKIATGKINAVTGEQWKQPLQKAPQDYVVLPGQPWLDGYCVERGTIRQFVAMPLGEGYTVEEQLTGAAEHGGLQIVVYPIKREAYERLHRPMFETRQGQVCRSSAMEMGLAPGGRMKQEVYEDSYGFENWDQQHSSRCFVTVLNAAQWHALTGEKPPSEPITAKQYAASGIPWFDYYAKDQKSMDGGSVLAKVKSVLGVNKTKDEAPLDEQENIFVPTPKSIGPDPRPVREPSNEVSEGDWQTDESLRQYSHLAKRVDDCMKAVEVVRGELTAIQDKLTQLSRRAGSPPVVRPKPRFFIEYGDLVFERDTAAETMADFLQAVGLERVARLNLRIARLPLVSRQKPPQDRGSCQRGEWFVVTHASNADKKAVLEQVVDMLGLTARIRIQQLAIPSHGLQEFAQQ
jgi:hypothetical protein